MGVLRLVFIVFLILFPITEVGRLQFSNGVAISLNDILLILLIFAWFRYKFLITKDHNINGKLKKPLVIFIAFGLLSLLLNYSKLNISSFLISFSYLVRFSAYALIYFIVKDFDKKFKKTISYLLIFSGAVIVILGYVQYFLYPSLRNLFYLGWDEHLYRMFSSFLDPNFAGVFFCLFFIYLIGFLRDSFKKKQFYSAILYFLLACLTLGSVYLTYSRSALLMLITGVIIFLVLISKKKYIILALVGLVLLIFLAPKSFQSEGTNFLRVTSAEERVSSAVLGIKIFSTNPIFGIGFNAYRYAQNRLGGMNNQYWQITHSGGGTDNSFLFILATTGIIGFIFFAYLVFEILRLAKDNLTKNKYSLILISVLGGLLVSSFFVNSLFYVFILEWLWILCAFTESS